MTASRKRKRSRSSGSRSSTSTPALEISLPGIPSLEAPAGTTDGALAALEQTALPPAADDESLNASPAPAPTPETANTPAPSTSAGSPAPPRDRSHVAPTSEKPSAPKKPQPIALEARELKGLQVSELRTLLIAERRRNAELTTRLQVESPIAQAALDVDLQQGIAETTTLLSEGVAFMIDEPDAKLPPKTSERLGRVWAPIVKKYLGEELQKHLPLYVACTATLAAVMDRAVDVKEARQLRRVLEAERVSATVTSSSQPAVTSGSA